MHVTVLCFSLTYFSLFSLYISVFVFSLLLDKTSFSRGGKGVIVLKVIYLGFKKIVPCSDEDELRIDTNSFLTYLTG